MQLYTTHVLIIQIRLCSCNITASKISNKHAFGTIDNNVLLINCYIQCNQIRWMHLNNTRREHWALDSIYTPQKAISGGAPWSIQVVMVGTQEDRLDGVKLVVCWRHLNAFVDTEWRARLSVSIGPWRLFRIHRPQPRRHHFEWGPETGFN